MCSLSPAWNNPALNVSKGMRARQMSRTGGSGDSGGVVACLGEVSDVSNPSSHADCPEFQTAEQENIPSTQRSVLNPKNTSILLFSFLFVCFVRASISFNKLAC